MSLLGKAVVIVGMPRSGTSSVACALERLGVYFGEPESLYQGDESNEGGYWEHKRINSANRKFVLSMGQETFDIDPIPSDWRERPLTESMISSTVALWDSQFSNRPLWGWKDPQASAMLPFVRECFERVHIQPSVVICVRNPLDVATSSTRRHGTPQAQTLGGWLVSTLSALRDSRGLDRSVIVFSRLLDDPKAALEPVVEGLDLKPTVSEWDEARESVRPEASHGAAILGQLDAHSTPIKATYELCLAAQANHAGFLAGEFDEEVERLWEEWTEWRSFFARPPFPEATLGLSWKQGGRMEIEQNVYRPIRGWQTISAKTKAPGGARVSVLLYPLPAIVWVRRAVWKTPDVELPAKLIAGRHGQMDQTAGLQRVWLFFGPEQLAVDSPPHEGEIDLELEILIETSNVITGMTFQDLSQRLLG